MVEAPSGCCERLEPKVRGWAPSHFHIGTWTLGWRDKGEERCQSHSWDWRKRSQGRDKGGQSGFQDAEQEQGPRQKVKHSRVESKKGRKCSLLEGRGAQGGRDYLTPSSPSTTWRLISSSCRKTRSTLEHMEGEGQFSPPGGGSHTRERYCLIWRNWMGWPGSPVTTFQMS